MAIAFESLISDRAVRWGLASIAIVASTGATTFIMLRLQTIEVLQTENVRLKAEVVELQRQLDSQLTATHERMQTVEETLFGKVMPEVTDPAKAKPTVIVQGPAAWQQNRDRSISNRLLTLEQYRMQLETRLHAIERQLRELRNELR